MERAPVSDMRDTLRETAGCELPPRPAAPPSPYTREATDDSPRRDDEQGNLGSRRYADPGHCPAPAQEPYQRGSGAGRGGRARRGGGGGGAYSPRRRGTRRATGLV